MLAKFVISLVNFAGIFGFSAGLQIEPRHEGAKPARPPFSEVASLPVQRAECASCEQGVVALWRDSRARLDLAMLLPLPLFVSLGTIGPHLRLRFDRIAGRLAARPACSVLFWRTLHGDNSSIISLNASQSRS